MKTEQEKLTEAERRDLWLGECGVDWQRKALRIIDAQAARVTELEGWYTRAMRDVVDLNKSRGATERENARLTEQVAQLTAERNEAHIECESQKTWRLEDRHEVARLTEALAAAELNNRANAGAFDKLSSGYLERAEAAERDRDAALALPGRIWEALGELTSYVVDGDHMVRVDDVRRTFEAHLSSQPAQAPTSTLGHPGADEVFARLRQARQPAAPACVGCTKHTTWDDCPVHATAPAPTTAEAELTETPELRPGCTHADYYEPAPTAAEVELTALRERVARAIAALTRNHVRRALEALRGR